MKIIKKTVVALALVAVMAGALIGLSSWKSPQSKKSFEDTTRKSGKKEARYTKKTIITFDKDGKPHEQIVEDFEGDESLRKLFDGNDFNFDFNFDFPPMPAIPDFDMPELPHDFMEGLNGWDTLNFDKFHLDDKEFELLNENMEDMQEKFEALDPEFEMRMKEMEERFKDMELNFDSFGKDLEDKWSRIGEDFGQDFHLKMENLQDELSHLEEFNGAWEKQIKDFENEAQEELIKDGYLKPNEKIESMQWSDDEIKFNGTPIKKEHWEKYKELKQKHLKRHPFRGRQE